MFNNKRKEVTRLNLLFDHETCEQGEFRLKKAMSKREQMFYSNEKNINCAFFVRLLIFYHFLGLM